MIYIIYDLHVIDVIIPDVLHHLRNYQLRLPHENYEVINTYEILAYSQHITVVVWRDTIYSFCLISFLHNSVHIAICFFPQLMMLQLNRGCNLPELRIWLASAYSNLQFGLWSSMGIVFCNLQPQPATSACNFSLQLQLEPTFIYKDGHIFTTAKLLLNNVLYKMQLILCH